MRRIGCLAVLLVWASSCVLPTEGAWARDGGFSGAGGRLGAAARAAALDPWTWAPLVGSAVLSIEDWDEDASRWAFEDNPIFGSPRRANRQSDEMRSILRWLEVGTTLAVPAGPGGGGWGQAKLEQLVSLGIASNGTNAIYNGLKRAFGRRRPDGEDQLSFPSGHAAGSTASAAWIRGVAPGLGWRPEVEQGVNLVSRGLALGTSLARVEAGRHYFTDVLAGAALGNFLATLVQGALLAEGPVRVTARMDPELESFQIGVNLRF